MHWKLCPFPHLCLHIIENYSKSTWKSYLTNKLIILCSILSKTVYLFCKSFYGIKVSFSIFFFFIIHLWSRWTKYKSYKIIIKEHRKTILRKTELRIENEIQRNVSFRFPFKLFFQWKCISLYYKRKKDWSEKRKEIKTKKKKV